MEIAVIDLDCLVPVIYTWVGTVAVVSCSHSRELLIWLHSFRTFRRKSQCLSRIIEEVVISRPMNAFIVLCAKAWVVWRESCLAVIAWYMIRDEIYDDLKSGLMRAHNELLELPHSIVRVISKIRIYIIVVADGVWRSGLTLYELWMRCGASLGGFLSRMPDQTCIPDMAASEPFKVIQCILVNVRELACAVILQSSVLLRSHFVAAPQAWQHLVYYGFVHNLSLYSKSYAKIHKKLLLPARNSSFNANMMSNMITLL